MISNTQYYVIILPQNTLYSLNCRSIPANGKDAKDILVEFGDELGQNNYRIIVSFSRSVTGIIETNILSCMPNSNYELLAAKVVSDEIKTNDKLLEESNIRLNSRSPEIGIYTTNWQNYFETTKNINRSRIESQIAKSFIIHDKSPIQNKRSLSAYDLFISLNTNWNLIISIVQYFNKRKFIDSRNNLRYAINYDRYDALETLAHGSEVNESNIISKDERDNLKIVLDEIKSEVLRLKTIPDDVKSAFKEDIEELKNALDRLQKKDWKDKLFSSYSRFKTVYDILKNTVKLIDCAKDIYGNFPDKILPF